VRFEWDGEKNRINQQKHDGLAFETAALVFDDPHAVFRNDRVVTGERRWHAIGSAAGVETRRRRAAASACAPLDHPIIPGAGGFRKARWARRLPRKEWWLSSDLLLHRGTRTDLYGLDIR
jgi:hypothetical protein